MRTTSASGLSYEADGVGHALVLIHGGLVDSSMWDDQFAEFAQHYRTVRYDLRGSGQSATPNSTYSDFHDLFEFLQSLGIERAYLMGSSGGAAVAIDCALRYPQLVDALLLVAPGVSGYTWSQATLQLGTEFSAYLQAGDLPRAVEARLRMLIDGPFRTPKQVDPMVRQRVGAMIAQALARLHMDDGSQPLEPPAVTRLSEIAAQASCIW